MKDYAVSLLANSHVKHYSIILFLPVDSKEKKTGWVGPLQVIKPALKDILFLDFAKSVSGFTGQQYMPILRLHTENNLDLVTFQKPLHFI